MPDVLDRPEVISDIKPETHMMPIWVLLVFETPQKRYLDLQLLLEKALPEFDKDTIYRITDELRIRHIATVKRDVKEIVEHYYEICKAHTIPCRMERE